jgi:hypothetical protein
MAAMSGSAKPTVFVYPFDSELTGEWMYQNLTAGDHDNHFRGELELLQRFKEHPQASPPPPAACCTHAHRPRLHLLRHHCPISGAASDCRHARRAMARRPSLHAA